MQSAELKFREALSLAREKSVKRSILASLNQLARICLSQNRIEEAERYAQEGLAMAKGSADEYWIAQHSCSMAYLHLTHSQYDSVTECLERAHRYFFDTGVMVGLADTYRAKSIFLEKLGAIPEAIAQAVRSASMYRKCGHSREYFQSVAHACLASISSCRLRDALQLAGMVAGATSLGDIHAARRKLESFYEHQSPVVQRIPEFLQDALTRVTSRARKVSCGEEERALRAKYLFLIFVTREYGQYLHGSLPLAETWRTVMSKSKEDHVTIDQVISQLEELFTSILPCNEMQTRIVA
jgi:tetratricopeptide (TPR) repeat protein